VPGAGALGDFRFLISDFRLTPGLASRQHDFVCDRVGNWSACDVDGEEARGVELELDAFALDLCLAAGGGALRVDIEDAVVEDYARENGLGAIDDIDPVIFGDSSGGLAA
jgi:hypothetical protein